MVVRVYLKQAWNLMKQNPLFSTLYIVGTGISIVMTMVIAIVYYVRLAPVYPETNRMRTLVVKSAKMTNDESTHSANISYAMLKDWFYSLYRSVWYKLCPGDKRQRRNSDLCKVYGRELFPCLSFGLSGGEAIY